MFFKMYIFSLLVGVIWGVWALVVGRYRNSPSEKKSLAGSVCAILIVSAIPFLNFAILVTGALVFCNLLYLSITYILEVIIGVPSKDRTSIVEEYYKGWSFIHT